MALKNSVTVPLFLPHVFPLGLDQGLGKEVVNGSSLLLVILLIQVVTLGKESGLPGRHVQVYLLMSFRILGIQRRGDGKDCAPLPPEWGVRWAGLAIFFLGGACLRREQAKGFCWLVSPTEGASALAPAHF